MSKIQLLSFILTCEFSKKPITLPQLKWCCDVHIKALQRPSMIPVSQDSRIFSQWQLDAQGFILRAQESELVAASTCVCSNASLRDHSIAADVSCNDHLNEQHSMRGDSDSFLSSYHISYRWPSVMIPGISNKASATQWPPGILCEEAWKCLSCDALY